MAEIMLTQPEADALIAMEKHRVTDEHHNFPTGGDSLILPLQSLDKREQFWLDLSRSRIDLAKVKMQNRVRQVIVLVRLDMAGAPHRNPDGEEIGCPHLHVYREGFGDKWAKPIPADRFSRIGDMWGTFEDFLLFCSIVQPPHIERGLFT